ncbi:MAG: RHS repeat-associated core domain-containing protein [Terracidiphilus sp.]
MTDSSTPHQTDQALLALTIEPTPLTSPPGGVYNYTASYDGVGNLENYIDPVVMGTWNFGYDYLNRLTTAQNTAVTSVSGEYTNMNGCWIYDPFGNRTLEAFSDTTSTPCAPGAPIGAQYTVTTPTANNQVSGFQYDAAGNVLYDGQNNYLYDAEGRLCVGEFPALGGGWHITQYIYDAEGRRVAKGVLPSWPSSCNAPTTGNGYTGSFEFLFGPGGELVTEVNGSGTPQYTNAFADGKLLATYSFLNGGLHFALNDPLGTKRVQATINGSGQAVPELNYLSLPFGNDIGNPLTTNSVNVGNGGTDATQLHFTGKFRDTASGLDYFGARYYASSMGRFMSPDPSQLAYADPTNPQSFNLYSYAWNNPLVNTDPSGLECVWDDGSFDSKDDPQTGSSSGCSGQGGTWIDPTAFSTLHAGDWSNQANANIAGIAQDLNSTSTTIVVSAQPQQMDPDDARIMALVQGVATDTAGFPTICSVGAYGQINIGPLQGRYSYDSNSGSQFSGGTRVTPGAPDSINSPVTGKNTPLGSALPFSGSVRVSQKGSFSGSLGVRDPETGIGASVSVNDQGRPGADVSWARGSFKQESGPPSVEWGIQHVISVISALCLQGPRLGSPRRGDPRSLRYVLCVYGGFLSPRGGHADDGRAHREAGNEGYAAESGHRFHTLAADDGLRGLENA